MENSTIFFAYLVTWCGYLITVYALCGRMQLHRGIASVSHIVPSAIALLMIGIFLVFGGGTVAQFVSGSESGMNMWRLWFHLWPFLLVGAGLSTLAHLVWAAAACFMAIHRRWVLVSASGLLMSGFGFFTVIANFPDA